jgi:uncharacterized repeat protein (TIGR01451 family)
MKLPSCPRALIINILRKNPDGLTITSIAEFAKMHRHTATKYVYELKGAGVINERDVGSAKLCYLREGLGKGEEKKVLVRLNGNGNGSWNNGHRKSSAGQVQILTVFLFLFMVPAGIIIAQNATQSANATGELILGQLNLSNITETNQTFEISNASAIEANVTQIINETNETIASENQIPEENQTNQTLGNVNVTGENSTVEPVPNETIQNETIQNETNVTIVLPDNQTLPEIQENVTIPEILQPFLSVRITSPDKSLRGEQFDISAVVSNTGNSGASNVRMEWTLPEGMEIISGQVSADCGTLAPDSECTSSLTLSAPLSAGIGKNEIKVIVKYEE